MMFLDDDDGKTFEAALSFVDEYPFDRVEAEIPQTMGEVPMQQPQEQVDAASSSCDVVPVSISKIATPDVKRRRMDVNERKKLLRRAGVYGDSNRARNERTREIAELREQLEKLQISLKTLTSRKKKQLSETSQQNEESLGNENSMVLTSQTPSIWRELAERQQLRRGAAERANVRLRLAVERQRKVADSLQCLLQKRTSELVTECASLANLACGQHQIVNVFDFHGDVGEFQGLFKQLDAAYREIDAVFEANGMADRNGSPGDVHMREGVNGKYLEFFTRKALPFQLHDTTEAAWNHFKGVEKHMGYSSLYEKTAKDLDEPYTIIEDFKKEVYSNNARADVRMKQVVRRYVEVDRDIVIWVSRAVPIEIKHKMFLGMAYHFRGYAITKHSNASTPEHELSELQLCSLISLDLDAGTKYDPDTLRALTHFLIIHGAKDIRAHRELIENALVDRSLRLPLKL